MTIRSHVDPYLFCVFVNIRDSYMNENTQELIRNLELQQGESLDEIISKLHPRANQILFHETYHFWQGLRLPFIYWNALLSFRIINMGFRELAKHSTKFDEWSCEMPQLHRLTKAELIGHNSGGKLIYSKDEEKSAPDIYRTERVSPLDMLECAASLAEFQFSVTAEERISSISFKRWRKRNPGYFKVYDFTLEVLGDESLVLRTLLPLINQSFHTTSPIRTYIELLARVWGNLVIKSAISDKFLKRPEPCGWTELFQAWLDEIQYECEPDSAVDVLNCQYQRLTLEQWVGGSFGSGSALTHPFLTSSAKRWIDFSKQDDSLLAVMDFPGWYMQTTSLCRQAFAPPITIFRFNIGDDARIYLYGRGIKDWEFLQEGDFDKEQHPWRVVVADMFTMHGAVRRASNAAFDDHQRTCMHFSCPQFSKNYCNLYPIIPSDWRKCGFPARIDRQIKIFREL